MCFFDVYIDVSFNVVSTYDFISSDFQFLRYFFQVSRSESLLELLYIFCMILFATKGRAMSSAFSVFLFTIHVAPTGESLLFYWKRLRVIVNPPCLAFHSVKIFKNSHNLLVYMYFI